MIQKIFKYALSLHGLTDVTKIEMPCGAIPISAINQNETLAIYAIIDEEEKRKEKHKFRIVGTGFDLNQLSETTRIAFEFKREYFIGTVIFGYDSRLVLHIFDMGV